MRKTDRQLSELNNKQYEQNTQTTIKLRQSSREGEAVCAGLQKGKTSRRGAVVIQSVLCKDAL